MEDITKRIGAVVCCTAARDDEFEKDMELIRSHIRLENGKIYPSRASIFVNKLFEILSGRIDREEQFDLLDYVLANLDIDLSTITISSFVWRLCLYGNATKLIKYILDRNGKISRDGNKVRQAVYVNKQEIAKMLIEAGYEVPESIALFSISNQLAWDPERVQFLIDNGTTIDLSDKEKECLITILNAVGDSK